MRRLLIAACLVTATPAHAAWRVAQSKHFVVYSDDNPASVEAFATRLERLDRAIRVVLKLPDPTISSSARVTIFVVPSTDDIRRMTGADGTDIYRSQSPAGVWAFFPRRSPNDQTRRTPSPLMVLQHAYAHRVLMTGWPNIQIPAWLSEGFAEFFATAKQNDDGGVVLGVLPEYRWDGIDRANVFPIDRLVRGGPDYTNREEANIFIGRAWLLIDYLTFDAERSKQLSAYVAAILSGKSIAAANTVLDISAGLDTRLNAYGARPTWPSATLAPGQIAIEPVTTRALTASEAALVPAMVRSRTGADAAGARRLLDEVRAIAAPFAQDTAVQTILSQTAYDAGDFDLSMVAADRALTADPRSFDAMIMKGRAQIALAVRAKVKDQATWAQARSWFIAANKADPLYSYPVQLFYESFRAAGQTPTPAARKALLYAYTLNRTNVALRLEAACISLQDGDLAAARIALQAEAIDEYGGMLSLIAAKALQALNASGPDSATTILQTCQPAD